MEKEAKDFLSYEKFQQFAFEAGIEGVPNPDISPAFLNASLMKFGHALFNLGLEKGTSEAQKEAYEYLKNCVSSYEADRYIKEVDPPVRDLINSAMDKVISAAMNGKLDGEIVWSVTRALEAARSALPKESLDTESWT